MKIDKRMSLETALELEAKGKARLFPAFGTCWTRENKKSALVWSWDEGLRAYTRPYEAVISRKEWKKIGGVR